MQLRFALTTALSLAFAASACKQEAPSGGTAEAPAAAKPAEAAPASQPAAAAAAAPAAAPAAELPAAAVTEAQEIFKTRCTPCHGATGMGDGAASAALEPKPRNFSDPAWQTSVTDEHIEKIIQMGGAAVGKAPTMPGNPDLISKPDTVKALRAHVRGLKKG